LNNKQSQRGDQASSRGNRKSEEILAATARRLSGETIEAGEAKGAADQINRGDKPTQFRMAKAHEHISQHDTMDQKRGRGSKGNQVGEGIELTAKGAFDAAHPRDPAVKQIEDAGKQDKTQGQFDFIKKVPRSDIGFNDFGKSYESAKQIPRRQQVWEEINLEFRLNRLAGTGRGSRCRHNS
jgi:hypothetical protein